MDNLTYEDFVAAHFQVTARYGNEVMALCIFHDNTRTASLQINVATGQYICFSCGAKGGPRGLFRELGIPYNEVDMDLAAAISMLDRYEDELNGKNHRARVYDEHYLRQFDIPSRYWRQRGFTPETVKRFGLGCSPMGGYHTIPIRDVNGDLLGVVKRYDEVDEDEGDIRYRYPKHFSRSRNLFGADLIAKDDDATTVALVEGTLDAVPIWQAGYPAAAIYGSSFSAFQCRLLVRLGVQRVILWFDNDKAGRKTKRTALGFHDARQHGVLTTTYTPESDVRQYFDVLQVQWPEDPYPSVADPNDYANDPGSLRQSDLKRLWKGAGPIR